MTFETIVMPSNGCCSCSSGMFYRDVLSKHGRGEGCVLFFHSLGENA